MGNQLIDVGGLIECPVQSVPKCSTCWGVAQGALQLGCTTGRCFSSFHVNGRDFYHPICG